MEARDDPKRGPKMEPVKTMKTHPHGYQRATQSDPRSTQTTSKRGIDDNRLQTELLKLQEAPWELHKRIPRKLKRVAKRLKNETWRRPEWGPKMKSQRSEMSAPKRAKSVPKKDPRRAKWRPKTIQNEVPKWNPKNDVHFGENVALARARAAFCINLSW